MRSGLALSLSIALLAPAGAPAEQCGAGVKPATTLLLPYFEVDVKQVRRVRRVEKTTVVIQNPSPAPVTARVTGWTDMGFPVLAWDVPLRGYGSVELPLHEILRGDIRRLPGLEDEDSVAPPGVTGDDVIVRFLGDDIGIGCLTVPRGDKVARGYLTIDDTSGEGGLLGWVSFANRRARVASFEPLVHLEIDDTMPVSWAADFDLSGAGSTELIVWRDAGGAGPDTALLCEATEPNGGYPYLQKEAFVADESGERHEILVDRDGESIAGFPFATGRYELGRDDLELPIRKGTLFLDLSNTFGSWVSIRRHFENPRLQGQAQAAPLVCAN